MLETNPLTESNKNALLHKLFIGSIPPLTKARALSREQEPTFCNLIGSEALGLVSPLGPVKLTRDRYKHELFAIPYKSWAIMFRPQTNDETKLNQVKMDFCLKKDFENLQRIPRLLFTLSRESAFLKRRNNKNDVSGSMHFLSLFFDIAEAIGKNREVIIHPSDRKRSVIYAYYIKNRPEANIRLESPGL